jgi:alkylhydroperoxidase/carboxymuconolactone decarboxylase family protein YurZ
MDVMSRQVPFVSILQRLEKTAPKVADAFMDLRRSVSALGAIDAKHVELCLLSGFTAARNEGGFRVHCTRAAQAGATLEEVQHAVLLMLGSTTGLSPIVETLQWAQEEFDGMADMKARQG